jgi:hypothetical protein
MADHMFCQIIFSNKEARAHRTRDGADRLVPVRVHSARVMAHGLGRLHHLAAHRARRRLGAMRDHLVALEGFGRLRGVQAAGVRALKGHSPIVRLHVAPQRRLVHERGAAHRAQEEARPVGVVRFQVHLQPTCRFEAIFALGARVWKRLTWALRNMEHVSQPCWPLFQRTPPKLLLSLIFSANIVLKM